jgi:hypothetical protein
VFFGNLELCRTRSHQKLNGSNKNLKFYGPPKFGAFFIFEISQVKIKLDLGKKSICATTAVTSGTHKVFFGNLELCRTRSHQKLNGSNKNLKFYGPPSLEPLHSFETRKKNDPRKSTISAKAPFKKCVERFLGGGANGINACVLRFLKCLQFSLRSKVL